MEDIANNLQNPSWWFTAFFIAIIASVIAGFLKDQITRLLSKFSTKLKTWKEKKQLEQDEIINALAANDTYLNIALFRVLVALILFAISVVIYSTSPMVLTLAPENGTALNTVDREFFIWNVFFPIIGAFSALIGYKTTSRLSIVFKAIKKFRENNNFPKIP